MIAYGIGILPLIKRLKSKFPDVIHPWYADDAGALGKFSNVELYFNLLKLFGMGCGYFSKPSKSVLIVHPDNIESVKRFGFSHGFKVCTDVRYIGGFIRYDDSKCDWLKLYKETW